MTLRTEMLRVFEHEDVNFLLTNRIPRRLLTRFMGWFSRIEQPLVRDLSIGLWRFFSDLDLTEAKKADFRSMHECFTRELKDGARPVEADPCILVSPLTRSSERRGAIAGTELLQVKGFPYTLQDLLGWPALGAEHVRLFRHAAADVQHVSSLPRAARLQRRAGDLHFGRHLERQSDRAQARRKAVLQERTRGVANEAHRRGHVVTAGRGHPGSQHLLHFLDVAAQSQAPRTKCHSLRSVVRKSQEMGWFEHGSTIIVLAPNGFSLCDNARKGRSYAWASR
jgi:phosphatidylserine decarboxylase